MNLEKLNLVELDAQEVQETEGGIIPLLALVVEVACYAAAGDIMLNFNEYSKTLERKINQKR